MSAPRRPRSPRALSRRQFLQAAAAAGGGLVLAVHLPWDGSEAADATPEPAFQPNVWLRVAADGAVTVTIHRSELGQGSRTGLAMLLAEELDCDWARVTIQQADAGADAQQRYGSMTTGGSTSIRSNYLRLRQAGATARALLVGAAAQGWGVDPASCTTEPGFVQHPPTGRRAEYGALAATAATLPIPAEVALKDSAQFRLIGRRIDRQDIPSKVDGSARFGIDTVVPGMLVASVERCPVLGGKLRRFDGAAALRVPGVRQVLELPTGVAVVADSTWPALSGRAALRVEWDEGPHAAYSTAELRAAMERALLEPKLEARRDGDVAAALAGATRRVEALYELPLQAHAPMEPQNCVVHVRADGVEVWAPTQSPQWVHRAVTETLEVAPESVTVHVTLSGGGFGRRLMWDYPADAARLSKALGAPVKVVWTREDDMAHDFYRPCSLHRLEAGLDARGQVVAWRHSIAAPSIGAQHFGPPQPGDAPDIVDGAVELPYGIANVLVEGSIVETPVPLGWWRSVYDSQSAFANEGFVDELATAAGVDPLEMRRNLLPAGHRLRRVLELAAEKAAWGSPLSGRSDAGAARRGRGVACHASFGGFAAYVAEVVVDAGGRVRVERMVAAIDCGHCVLPDAVVAQTEGAVAFALSAALKGRVTVERGRIEQQNFDDFPIMTLDEMPRVEVHIVPTDDPIGGVGEPGVPPAAPAVCNAIFAATGQRVRALPIALALGRP